MLKWVLEVPIMKYVSLSLLNLLHFGIVKYF